MHGKTVKDITVVLLMVYREILWCYLKSDYAYNLSQSLKFVSHLESIKGVVKHNIIH
jgi:hypothetical protein